MVLVPSSLNLHECLPVLGVNDVSVLYDGIKALESISGTFLKGTKTAIIGPNGGGKSTFLKVLQGIIKPNKGEVVRCYKAPEMSGYLPQQTEINRSFPISVIEVVSMGMWPYTGAFKKIPAEGMDKIYEALHQVGMHKKRDNLIGTLSGGQLQRVLFARLIVQNPQILLLDEPFNGLDNQTKEELLQLIAKWAAEGRTIIAVLHDFNLVKEFFQYTLMIATRCKEWGETQEVFRRGITLLDLETLPSLNNKQEAHK